MELKLLSFTNLLSFCVLLNSFIHSVDSSCDVTVNNICFTVETAGLTFSDAENSCFKTNGSLAILDNDSKTNAVATILAKKNISTAFFGLTDRTQKGIFRWINNTVLLDEGSIIQGSWVEKNTESCIVLNSAGLWIKSPCNNKIPYICEIENSQNSSPPIRVWSQWLSMDKPNLADQYLTVDNMRKRYPTICPMPDVVECRVVGTNESSDNTGDKFQMPCSTNGLICNNADQNGTTKCNYYQLRFLCPSEIDECSTGLSDCDQNAKCFNTYGSYKCVCNSDYSGDGKTCFKTNQCVAWGDPHYISFDQFVHHFMGTCSYILTETCFHNSTGSNLVPFQILTANENRGTNTNVAYTKSVTLNIKGLTIQLGEHNTLSINGSVVAPPQIITTNDVQLHVVYNTRGLKIETSFGLIVLYDGVSRVTVSVPDSYANQTCGLCGNMNGNISDDSQVNGTEITNSNTWGQSWVSGNNTNCGSTNSSNLNALCNSANSVIVHQQCGFILSPTGPFNVCLSLVDPQTIYPSCFVDLCSDPNNNDLVCEAYKMYADKCSEKGVLIDWMSSTNCVVKCGDNEHYESQTSGCQGSCANPNAEDNCHIHDTSGCVCNDGYLRSGTGCISKESCGCHDTNINYKQTGDVWYTGFCSTKNTCTGSNTIKKDNNVQCNNSGKCYNVSGNGESNCSCTGGQQPNHCISVDECSLQNMVCSDDGDCVKTNSSYVCVCQNGFSGNGIICKDVNECVDGTAKCTTNTSCINMHGSFRCDSQPVFTGVAKNYTKVSRTTSAAELNTCSLNQDLVCAPLSYCTDMRGGGFSCSCIDGTFGDALLGANHTGCTYYPCPQNSYGFKGYCYTFIPALANQTDQEKVCNNNGGHLATFIDTISLNFISQQLQIFGSNSTMYIGYSSTRFKNFYLPVDYSLISNHNWATGHPKSGLSCVSILPYSSAQAFQFISVNCSELHQAICKFPSSPRLCPDGWQNIGTKCVSLFINPSNVFEASIECARLGGDLGTVQSNNESNSIFTRLLQLKSGSFWFGLNKNLFQRSSVAQWLNNAVMNFQNYNSTNQTSSLGMAPDIGCYQILSTGFWVATNCSAIADGFLCEKPLNVFYRCPLSSEYFNGLCYRTVSNNTKSATEQTCSTSGGHLISINTYGEQNFLEHYLYSTSQWSPSWIGLEESNTTSSLYSWSDSSLFEYMDWDQNEPGKATTGNCVIAKPSNMNTMPWSESTCTNSFSGVCEYLYTPCKNNTDCILNAECNLGQCRCQSGFKRDNNSVCTNIDECIVLKNPCQTNEVCTDTPGSFMCNCTLNYVRLNNGTCQNALYCLTDTDCVKYGTCYQNLCMCNTGFQGNAKLSCNDINECLNPNLNHCNINANCTNTIGSYTCQCLNGYQGNGITKCSLFPRTCDEFLQQNPNSPSGVYTVDPDGVGPLLPIAVTCQMRPTIGITVISHNNMVLKLIQNTKSLSENRTITYQFPLNPITSIVGNSNFCYQDMTFLCNGFMALLDSTNYFDINGKQHKKWGSSSTENKCGCGEINACGALSKSCFCDGSYNYNGYETGRIIDKSLLPLTGILTGGVSGSSTGSISIGALYCSPIPINLPKDCHDAKVNYDVAISGVTWIDVDEAGPFQPIKVMCDVTTKPFGVTIIPHQTYPGSATPFTPTNFPGPLNTPSGPKGNPTQCFTYPADDPSLLTLISNSGGCTQEVRYKCQVGSQLLNNVAYLQTTNSRNIPYFGSGSNKQCACGVLGACINATSDCNCNGKNSAEDFGFIRNKGDLPIKCFVDNNKSPTPSTVTVGPLMCGPGPFGLEPTCNDWLIRGYTSNYTYLVDPDGGNVKNVSSNVNEFLVICIMNPSPPNGITQIPKTQLPLTCVNQTNKLCKSPITYPMTPTQIQPLIARSAFCTQRMKYVCQIMTLLVPYSGHHSPYSFWRKYGSENINVNKSYFAGNGSNNAICSCGLTGNCSSCFCDVASNVTKLDDGHLLQKSDLPVGAVWIGQDSTVSYLISQIEVGDLFCYDSFPSCEFIYRNFVTTTEKWIFYNTDYTIDPDGPFGENPFTVQCSGPSSIISPNIQVITIDDRNSSNVGPARQCFQITYQSLPNTIQLKKLTSASSTCFQYMKLSCTATPLTKYVQWYDIDGIKRPGWAGNSDGDECACGQVDSCRGGNNFSCNCDSISSDPFYDHGLLVNKDILPVSQICVGLTEKVPPPKVIRTITVNIGPIQCGPVNTELYIDCQRLRENQNQDPYRNFNPQSEAWVVDPDGTGPGKPFTVYCNMIKDLPVGITVFKMPPNPILCSNNSLPINQTTLNFTYLAATPANITSLMAVSSFCEQYVSYNCDNAPLFDGTSYGAYDQSANYINYWLGPNDQNACTNATCKCAVSDNNVHSDSGNFTDKLRLPLSKIIMPAVRGNRTLCVSGLRCYNIPRTCAEYNNQNRLGPLLGNQNNIWAIDPDQAGGEQYFGVLCKTVNSIIVTETLQTSATQSASSSSAITSVNVSYVSPNMKQLHNLINISMYCSQRLDYLCVSSGTLNNNAPTLYDYSQNPISSWAGADLYNMGSGCACNILGTCPRNYTCRCDALSNITQYEGGIFTNKNILPLQSVKFRPKENIQINFYPIDCGSAPFGLPTDCVSAKTQGYILDTEVLIMPKGVTQPFLVFCQMNAGINKNTQITVVPAYTSVKSNIITYPSGSIASIRSLVVNSAYCLQPMKVSCQGIMLSSLFRWTDSAAISRKDFGTYNLTNFCPCGLINLCAGVPGESRASMIARKCSCDTPNYDVNLFDSVVIKNMTQLPITSVDFQIPSNFSLTNTFLIGPLMCSNTVFDYDECATGFNDCDLHATCSNVANGYTCACIAGWRGIGGNEMYSNGRSCIDDNECVLNICPNVSTCINTPGSFICNCFIGFKKTAPTVCTDINECALNSSICDSNAKCTNTYGSYKCSCKPGFRGSGQPGDCQAVATCSCWGDPHCLSFDSNWLHYQGFCKYTLVRDKCSNGLPIPSSTPSFDIVMKTWNQNQESDNSVSWVKELTVNIKNYTIMMKIGFILTVNGQKSSIPFSPKNEDGSSVGFEVSFYGYSLRLSNVEGLEVLWDGDSRVDVTVPSQMMGKVCGLCGNYNHNPRDDWIIGPQCSGAGNVTTLLNLFGDSWKDDNPPDKDPACSVASCRQTPNQEVCAPSLMTQATLQCQQMTARFSACEALMITPNLTISQYIDSCVYDICNTVGNTTQMICKTAESLAQKCLRDYNINVAFRSNNFCNKTCNANMVYSTCGSPCQPTCVNNSDSILCTGSCVEGCFCLPGYVLDNGNCIAPSKCGCLMSDGTYYSNGEHRTNEKCSMICGCNGKTGQLDCVNITCSNDAFCDFKYEDYGCHCKNGFMGDGVNCTDINECSIVPAACDTNAICNNTLGSYTCTCKDGFEGNGAICSNINECIPVSPCHNITEECFDTIPGYNCKCVSGFVKNTTTGNCEDKDECADTGNLCDRVSTTCNNTFGSYRCDCKHGFRPSPVDSFVCTDVNECNLVHECDKNYAKCTNTPGSYYCTCDSGFRGDGRNCTDINECLTNQVCQRPDATCVNLVGSYECRCLDGNPGCDGPNPCNTVICNKTNEVCNLGLCICQQGFNRNTSSGRCDDKDECATFENNCADRKANCRNTDGGFECECLYGYRMQLNNGSCENINECIENSHRCGRNAECMDTIGGYYCQCQTGYTGHCDECRDIDECALSLNSCDEDYATCENTLGSYKCQCNSGYSGDGSVCSEIDECMLGSHNCTGPKQFCLNTIGSFKCQCLTGYKLDNYGNCNDTDECSTAENLCDNNAICLNNKGSYLCICKNGYTGTGKNCQLKEGYQVCRNKVCSYHEHCVNGSCQCETGYKNSSNECKDIDECLNQTSCGLNADCLNNDGSFLCYCKKGYVGDGYICSPRTTNVDKCQLDNYCIDGSCYDGVCHCDSGFTFQFNRCIDDRCKNACPANAICSTSSGSVVCSCSIGTSLSSDSSQCNDIDECLLHYDDCQENSNCQNHDGYYSCQCKSGNLDVFGDGKICKGVNMSQCLETCPTGQYCQNGSCSCLPGLDSTLADGKLSCNKISNSCLPSTCPTNSKCKERLIGYLCSCSDGYEGVGIKSCTDIDECAGNIHNCSTNENCVNLPGSFNCSCKKGYSRTSPLDSCEAVNTTCKCGHYGTCDPNQKCICNPGYIVNVNGICKDVDECITSAPCHVLAHCNNTDGSYKCTCPENYYGDANTKCIEDKCKTNSLQCQIDEECTLTKFGSLCQKKACDSSELLIENKCVSANTLCQNITCGLHAGCIIENGRVDCFCDSGYSGDGETCDDIDECSNGQVSCPSNSRCQDKEGSYFCACNAGFERSGSSLSSDPCTDIDECKIPKSCAVNANCNNTVGSFQCSCNDGFIGDGLYNCQIDSQCKRHSGCNPDASCVLDTKSMLYECRCDSGFSGDGVHKCIKDNYCFVNGNTTCHVNAECLQVNSTYQCVCPAGFLGDGYNFCNDIDECSNRTKNSCSKLETCINLDGYHMCACANGTSLVNDVCTDIDECNVIGMSNCSANAICINKPVGYSCKCKNNFVGDGLSCTDVDECKIGTHNCSINALCINKPGSFACECQAGTLGNGTTCGDTDECSIPKGSQGAPECDDNAVCIDKDLGYTCKCKPGFVGTGWFCIKESPCNKPGACNINQTCTPSGDNSKAICDCKPDFEPHGDLCVPKLECTNGTATCDNTSSICIQLDRGYKCDCKPGYKKVGNSCQDKNECDPTSPDYAAQPCAASGGGCLNTKGSFVCLCSAKQAQAPNSSCKPLNSCALGIDGCNRNLETCVNNADSSYSCKCISGFAKVNGVCTDIDECGTGTDSCKKNATCNNTIGSYVCVCPANLKLDTSKTGCTDRNECEENPMICGDLSRCVNNEGGYACVCITGFKWNGTYCKDIDECANKTHPCHKFAVCSNVPGSCTCKCQPGYTGDGIYKCSETDTCSPSIDVQCPPGSYCNKIGNVIFCNCTSGYKESDSMQCIGEVCYKQCNDINECDNKTACHALATCTNIEGAYTCICPSNLIGDGKISCGDQDECSLNTHTCNTNTSYCENLNNSVDIFHPFQCHCFNGFIKIPGTQMCVNQNECLNPADNNCIGNSRCVDTDGSYECKCEAGYKQLPSKACVNVDECTEKLDNCSSNSVCVDTVGSYVCHCNSGYVKNSTNPSQCIDINECDNPTSCFKVPNSICMNHPGSFQCVCPQGSTLQNGSCIDNNECLVPKICGNNGTCVDKVGGFNCTCKKFTRQLPNGDCELINECLEQTDMCKVINGVNSSCFDLPAGYGCTCPPGFVNDPYAPHRCQDLNECRTGQHNCQAGNSQCVNSYGSFVCECFRGYTESDDKTIKCEDINECDISDKHNLNICNNGTCHNTIGSYSCVCSDGYFNVNNRCTDIDECSLNPTSSFAHSCDPDNGVCNNTPGGYNCSCSQGFVMIANSTKCQDINECDYPNVCLNGLCNNLQGSYECICNKSYNLINGKCQEVDECLLDPTRCGDPLFGICVNKKDGYRCQCNIGYENSGKKSSNPCQMINECVKQNVICPSNSICVDRSKGYECVCKKGYVEDEIGICRNIDECLNENSCHYLADCTDTDGSYNCDCKYGYVGDGRISCESVCDVSSCPKPQMCRVVNGNNFECSCQCQGDICAQNGAVCGSDGITYVSEKEMFETNCKKNIVVDVEYYHECKNSCQNVICPGAETCSMVNKRPTCLCNNCTDDDLTPHVLCSSNGIEFQDLCQMKGWMCATRIQITVSYDGPCRRAIDCQLSQWSAWSSCSRTCGIGRSTRKRHVVQAASYNGKCDKPLFETDQCYNGPCPGDACENMTCATGSFCQNGHCICPSCSGEQTIDPVCGMISNRPSGTFRSYCTLIHNACVYNASFTYLHKGVCGEHVPSEPQICSMVTHFEKVQTSDNCTSTEPIRTNLCSGGCGKNPSYCCRALTIRTLRARFHCPDNSFVYREVESISSCHCKLEGQSTTVS